MKLLSNFIFLEYDKKEKKSGIVLSDVSKNKPAIATVISVGDGRLDRHGNLIKTTLKKGDKVIVDPFILREIEVEKEKYLVCREDDIYGIL